MMMVISFLSVESLSDELLDRDWFSNEPLVDSTFDTEISRFNFLCFFGTVLRRHSGTSFPKFYFVDVRRTE